MFSPERLFTPFGSNITDADVLDSGQRRLRHPPLIKAFGAVFADVDVPNATSIQFFDISDMLLGSIFAPVSPGGLSFAGVLFNAGEAIARVRLTTGTALPGAVDGTSSDVVFMDDFIYSRANTVPEPATLLLSGLGLVASAAGPQASSRIDGRGATRVITVSPRNTERHGRTNGEGPCVPCNRDENPCDP